jgi:Cytochrome C oxidase, cbb3-type, subunit III
MLIIPPTFISALRRSSGKSVFSRRETQNEVPQSLSAVYTLTTIQDLQPEGLNPTVFIFNRKRRDRILRIRLMLAAGVLGISLLMAGCGSKKEAGNHSEDLSTRSAKAPAEWHPRPLTGRKFERTPERMTRGKYLVEHVAGCFGCHSLLDFKKPGLPPKPGFKGGGDVLPPDEAGLPPPYRVVHPNISPDMETGAGKWTDDLFARAIREGVGHDDRKLTDFMPYRNFRYLPDEDLASIVVYVRSIPPVHRALPESYFPEWLLNETHTKSLPGPVPPPDLSTPVKRGEWLVRIADCSGCHTPTDEKLEDLPGMYMAGGGQLKGRWGEVYSANLTPDPSSPFYTSTPEQFIKTIHTGKVTARVLNSIMPWRDFKGLTDEDLRAIYVYLRTLKPVKHRVDNTEPPTNCRLCGQKHGLGYMN